MLLEGRQCAMQKSRQAQIAFTGEEHDMARVMRRVGDSGEKKTTV